MDGLRISVFAGLVFGADDKVYRTVPVPREFWKVVAYVTGGSLKTRAFLLTQSLDRLEDLDLDAFATYQVTIGDLEERTSVAFGRALHKGEPKAVRESLARPRRLESLEEISW